MKQQPKVAKKTVSYQGKKMDVNVPMRQVKPQPKPKPKAQNYGATKEDSAFSKRSGIPLSEVMAQGGVTPRSVMKEIEKQGAYTVRMKPTGLYKKPAKKK